MARDQKVKVRIEAQDSASGTVEKVEGRFSKLGSSIKANALKITAALASVALAFREIERGAEQVGQRRALERNLASQGIAIEEFIGELKRLSDNQIATNELILASNRALKLGIQAEDLPGLMTTAANAAVELGISTTQAFNDITTGVGRASPLILDNLGIVIDANKVYGDYAASIGVASEELTKQQKTIALTKGVIQGATGAIEDFSKKQDELTRSINRGRAAFENLRSSTFQVAGGLAQMVAGGLTATVIGFSLLAEAAIKAARAVVSLGQILPFIGRSFTGIAESLKEADDGIDSFQKRAAQLALDLSKGGANLIKFGLGAESAEKASTSLAKSVESTGDALEKTTKQTDSASESLEEYGDSADSAAESTAALVPVLGSVNTSLKAIEQQAIRTAAQFDVLAASAGRAAAIAAALQGGATLVQGGTRIRFSGGGSRLTSTSSLSGKFFNPEKRSYVEPDGNVVFI